VQIDNDLAVAARVWNDPDESLESINRRIHDGVCTELLTARVESYANQIFDLFPYARPKEGATIMEIGSGVGYIMDAMDKATRFREITPNRIIGLDIAEHMLARARNRLYGNPIFSFLHYDGVYVPLPDHSLDLIYSVASLQHVPRPYVFNLFYEFLRLLKHDGYAVVQLLGVKMLRPQPERCIPWREEIQNQVSGAVAHRHYYYSEEELRLVYWSTGFRNFDVRDGNLIWSLVQPGQLSVPANFDPAVYLALNPDVATAGADPETHWIRYGHREWRKWAR
jgi:ubiquinone/menaquinone biosynthesis C-methylase UbiE